MGMSCKSFSACRKKYSCQFRVIRCKKNSVPSPARNHSGVDIVRSRIAVSATLPVPYRVLRLAFAMTRRVDCRFFVSLTNSRNVICPLALRSLKTLKALNLGKNKRAVFYDNQDNFGQHFFPELCEESSCCPVLFYVVLVVVFPFPFRAPRGIRLLLYVVVLFFSELFLCHL